VHREASRPQSNQDAKLSCSSFSECWPAHIFATASAIPRCCNTSSKRRLPARLTSSRNAPSASRSSTGQRPTTPTPIPWSVIPRRSAQALSLYYTSSHDAPQSRSPPGRLLRSEFVTGMKTWKSPRDFRPAPCTRSQRRIFAEMAGDLEPLSSSSDRAALSLARPHPSGAGLVQSVRRPPPLVARMAVTRQSSCLPASAGDTAQPT